MTKVDVRLLEFADDPTVAALARLLPEVSSRAAPLTADRTKLVLENPSTDVIVATVDREVVGMALLLACTTLTGRFGLVEEVAVDDSMRGQHVGGQLMRGLLNTAKKRGFDFVELTSRPSREAANGLYQSLGFRRRETNVYRHDLHDSAVDSWAR